MVTIRLARGGAKRRPFYGIMVADQRKSPRGRFIERIGFFNPRAVGGEERLRIDTDRVDYWIDQGAQPSDRVVSLLKQFTKGSEVAAAEAAELEPAKEVKNAVVKKATEKAEEKAEVEAGAAVVEDTVSEAAPDEGSVAEVANSESAPAEKAAE